MRDASCRREDIITAFEDLCHHLDEQISSLWDTYREATNNLSHKEYDEVESECWQVLLAGLAGAEAERRILESKVEKRLSRFDGEGAVA